jgi:hypothetical protein
MRQFGLLAFTLGCLMLGNQLPSARAQGPFRTATAPPSGMTFASYTAVPGAPQTPQTPQAPGRPTPEQMAQPPAAGFGEAAPAGTEGSGSYAPQMLGDSQSFFSAGSLSASHSTVGARLVTVLAASGFKITENEGVRPETRVFLGINYFTGLYHSEQLPGEPRVRFTRFLLGSEHGFLDDSFSIGIRVPYFQETDEAGGSLSGLGSVTLIGKAVLAENRDTGNCLVGGLALTLPTGQNYPAFQTTLITIPGGGTIEVTEQVDSINPTIIQPYLGFVYWPSENLYVHGFSALAFATDDDVPVVWFNDIAAGAFLYRGRELSVVPTAEFHLTTPFGHEGTEGFPVGVVHTLITTLATHLVWNDGPRVTFGVGFPLTGPQPFSTELIAQLNVPY